ncbi:MAG: hypothetical protein GQ574_05070 [Crocinitomix sp.]|nr:hypothetical protein [Crocinitomix sp.]
MKSFKKFLLLAFLSLFLVASCKKEGTGNLELRLNNLPNIADGVFMYEGWLIVDYQPVSIGQFRADDINDTDGESLLLFDVDKKILKQATSFMLTIEKTSDLVAGPNQVKFLAGDFKENTVELTTNHPNGIGIDLSKVGGEFWIGTPTDNSLETNEVSGIWFYYPGGMNQPLLSLPELNNNWTYEATVRNCGLRLPIGKFTKARGADDRNNFGDINFAPLFPGEDFISTLDEDILGYYNFPLNLSNYYVNISISPKRGDNFQNAITILSAQIPETAEAHGFYSLTNRPAEDFQYGTVTRN